MMNRLERARLSLEGLSVGDAYGECSFRQDWSRPPWRFTDDTVMALSIVEILERHGTIDPSALAAAFLRRYRAEPVRGYGRGMHELFGMLREGTPARIAARAIHGGSGSLGNGSAMRVPPLGAWFADDLPELVDQAARSAAVTHAHPQGIAGAIAVAVATAFACGGGDNGHPPPGDLGDDRHASPRPAPPTIAPGAHGFGGRTDLIEAVLPHVPAGPVRDAIEIARSMADSPPEQVAEVVGNGSRVTCADTVPFVLWCARAHLDDYEAAIKTATSVGGDRDTIAAMVGGIVVMRCGLAGIPDAWRKAREALP